MGDSRSILAKRDGASSAPSHTASTEVRKRGITRSASGSLKYFPYELSEVLKPLDELESKRINDLGGFVAKNGRVLGVLAVSRALGDIDFHPYVTHVPRITCHEIDTSCRSLCMACDGVWDVFSQEEVVNLIHSWADAQSAAAMIRDSAYVRGVRTILACS